MILTTENGDKREIRSIFDYGRAKKIEWAFNGLKKQIVAQGEQVFIPISLPYELGFMIFFKNYDEFVEPCNVALLNLDGTIRKKICPPLLVSDLYKSYEQKFGKTNAKDSVRFIQHEFLNSTELALWVGFGYDFYEVRKIDVTSGEFGNCVRSGRL